MIRLFPLHSFSPSLHSLYDLHLCLYIRQYHLSFPVSVWDHPLTPHQSRTSVHESFPLLYLRFFLGWESSAPSLAFFTRYRAQQLNHQAEGGSLAEEVVATILTAHDFGVQREPLVSSSTDMSSSAIWLKSRWWWSLVLGSLVSFLPYTEPTDLVRPLPKLTSTVAHSWLAFQFGTTLVLAGESESFVSVSIDDH